MRTKVSNILKMEAECHRRQATGECCREGVGCDACDLSTADITDDDVMNAYTTAIETVKHSRPMWIPVTERLPDDGGVFLVTTVGKSFNGKNDIYIVEVMSLWHKDGHLEWRDNLVFESEWYNKKVVAWMPLPEPYKEEGDAE